MLKRIEKLDVFGFAAVRRQTDLLLVCFKKVKVEHVNEPLRMKRSLPPLSDNFISYSTKKKNEIFIFLVFAANIMSCTVGDSSEWGILVFVIDRFLLVIQ